jgi:acyl dehydratase
LVWYFYPAEGKVQLQSEDLFMSRNIHGPVLQNRRYSEDLQRQFADLSGDYNPMHVDAVAARRTLVGGRAVHGIHQTLAAIEALLARFAKQKRSDRTIAGFKAQFLKPVLVGDVVALHLTKINDESCLITGRIAGEIVCRVSVQFGTIPTTSQIDLPPLPMEKITELSIAELAGKTGSLALGLDAILAGQLFPLTTTMLGNHRMAATLALSRLVGMHCPGLHSIFAETNVRYDGEDGSDALHYRIEELEERYSRVILAVHGARLRGQLVVFFRPPPQAQPGMTEVMRVVEPGAFSKSVVLIVGGSRGLGEVTAKIIAAGGGLPIITYHQGSGDAEKVAADIRAHGGRCETIQLDVQASPPAIRRLIKSKTGLRTLYYFATPKIPGRQRGFFNHGMLHQFNEIYVTAFGRLIDAVAETCPTKLRVFYPSSIMVSTGMDKMEEYIMAKRLAEELCSFYNQNSKKVEIVVERLSRAKTDQTNSIIPLPAENALEMMLPLVRRMERFPAG